MGLEGAQQCCSHDVSEAAADLMIPRPVPRPQELAECCGQEARALIDVDVLDLSGKTTKEAVWDGIGAIMQRGKAQTLK